MILNGSAIEPELHKPVLIRDTSLCGLFASIKLETNQIKTRNPDFISESAERT